MIQPGKKQQGQYTMLEAAAIVPCLLPGSEDLLAQMLSATAQH